MRYLVIRRKADNLIEALGPDNGSYAPGYDATLCSASLEDMETALAEYAGYVRPPTAKQAAKTAIQAYLDGTMTARDAIAAIKDAL